MARPTLIQMYGKYSSDQADDISSSIMAAKRLIEQAFGINKRDYVEFIETNFLVNNNYRAASSYIIDTVRFADFAMECADRFRSHQAWTPELLAKEFGYNVKAQSTSVPMMRADVAMDLQNQLLSAQAQLTNIQEIVVQALFDTEPNTVLDDIEIDF